MHRTTMSVRGLIASATLACCALGSTVASAHEGTGHVHYLGGSHTVDVSPGTLAFLDTFRARLHNNVEEVLDEEGYHVSVQINLRMEEGHGEPVTIPPFPEDITSIDSFSLTAPPLRSLAVEGGTLTISRLSVDVTSGFVYGDVAGSHGVALGLTHLWTASDWTLSQIHPEPGSSLESYFTYTLNNLVFTRMGRDAFVQALGLGHMGTVVLGSAETFGSLSSVIVATVPEPSTWALMGVGLVGVGALARRQGQRQGQRQAELA